MKRKEHSCKRHIVSIMFLVALISLMFAGCGKMTEVTYEKSQDGMEMSFTYYAKGDVVKKQTAKNRIPYSAVGVQTEEDAKRVLEPLVEEYRKLDGVEENIEYGEDFAVETLSIDYEKVDLKKLKELQDTEMTGDLEKGVSLEKSIAILENAGFKKAE